MISQHRIWLLALALCLSVDFPLAGAQTQQLEWIRQLGTADIEWSNGVSADSLGNVYISGLSSGRLGGPLGGYNAFLSKFDARGNMQWIRQLGTANYDASHGVFADSHGSVYISGETSGSLDVPNAGNADAFVSKYDASGNLQWTRQFGTAFFDSDRGISADALGNLYISGVTSGSLGGPNVGGYDAFIRKYNASGNLLWTRQSGTTSADFSHAVSADSLGNIYISGSTGGSLGGPNTGNADAFVSKYDASGNLQWTRQLGSPSEDQSRGVSADSLGNVFISGITRGSLGGPNAGDLDAFVSKYDASGSLRWTRQLGTNATDWNHGVSADWLGNVYITGSTGNDAFVSKYDTSGTLLWTHNLGTVWEDASHSVSADTLGNVYISGYTRGSLGGPYVGEYDAFVAKYSTIPEPGTLLLGMVAGVVLLLPRLRHA